jgi:TPR repeat protein
MRNVDRADRLHLCRDGTKPPGSGRFLSEGKDLASFIASGFTVPFKRFFRSCRRSSLHQVAGRRARAASRKNNRVGVMRIDLNISGIEIEDADLASFDLVDVDADEVARTMPADADGEALYDLGMLYAAGRSRAADLVAAHKWLNVAVMRGYLPAAQRRAELAQEMTSEEISVAQRQARLWLAGTVTRH